MKNCIFCKIVAGEIPCNKIYEDEELLSFLDINPANKGHVIIIPKKHKENLLEENPKIGENIVKISQKISKAIKEGLGAKSFNIVTNIGKEAGQEVFHTHIHLIPKYEGEETHFWKAKKTNITELTLQAEKIISKLD